MAQKPRSFVLLDELEKCEKGHCDDTISYGLSDPDDFSMSNWDAMILGPSNTSFSGIIYSLKIFCPDEYPKLPPEVKFITPISMKGVNPQGKMDLYKLPFFNEWSTQQFSIEKLLYYIKKEMKKPYNKWRKQPYRHRTKNRNTGQT